MAQYKVLFLSCLFGSKSKPACAGFGIEKIMAEKKKSTNAFTDHSRALRAKTATARRAAIIESGGMRIDLLLLPAPAQALREEMSRSGRAATAVISDLLLTLAEKK